MPQALKGTVPQTKVSALSPYLTLVLRLPLLHSTARSLRSKSPCVLEMLLAEACVSRLF
jgi:hypothetical protein